MSDGTWWQNGVLYQIYPRSFADSDGDGQGDLQGIRARLDHLEWLGIDGIWLSPTMPSPNDDWGYDVADYVGVHPDFGRLSDLDDLIADAAARGIRVLLDLVPNHTSDRHPWFIEALGSRDAAHRDYYVWADPAPDGGPPNNWLSAFGDEAWTLD
jgi:alpha-glucosidase